MEFGIALNVGGWAVLLIGALVFGVVAQIVGETRTNLEWAVDGIAVVLGGLVASELIVGWRTIEPVYEGLAIWPALFGGLVAGTVVEVVTRFSTGGHYTRPMAT